MVTNDSNLVSHVIASSALVSARDCSGFRGDVPSLVSFDVAAGVMEMSMCSWRALSIIGIEMGALERVAACEN